MDGSGPDVTYHHHHFGAIIIIIGIIYAMFMVVVFATYGAVRCSARARRFYISGAWC
jgi:hypothetical protein